MAGVNMRLKAGTMREMHWHITAEGSCRIVVVNTEGQNYIADVYPGDLWYFPPGIPHVLQGLNDTADGCEFLLVFDDGEFSEDSTFSVTDWTSHIPKEVLSRNFKVNASAFDHIPDRELYMIPTAVPTGTPEEEGVKSPQGVSTLPYTFAASKINATEVPGGTVKVVDSRIFKVSKTIALAEVTVEVGGMRELHVSESHFSQNRELTGTLASGIQPNPNVREMPASLCLQLRVTHALSIINREILVGYFFVGSSKISTTSNPGYVPPSFGHYVENIGNTTLKFLEIFNSDKYEDISLNQWLALTPPDMVKAHLQLSDDTISKLQKVKPVVVGPERALEFICPSVCQTFITKVRIWIGALTPRPKR
ncbi:putative oxalate decarboxylase [Rhizoctonia solani AG-1 IA]|uniref:Putative oxalate decarboxylase n=1 Tax=Thanatephorus cucumeris (strain AG1-IA) TaxID=983506 RepID=L8WFY5_THACA|nr:putative oxalate decarboxylase [Rhizoctonia solani AG-1 IA]